MHFGVAFANVFTFAEPDGARAGGRIGAAVRALPVLTASGLLIGGLSLAARALVRV